MSIIKLCQKIISINNVDIKINYYQEHEKLIFKNLDIEPKIKKKLKPLVNGKVSSIFPLSLSSLNLLFFFDTTNSELNIGCERLSREHIYLSFNSKDSELKEHVLKFKNAKDLISISNQVTIENELIDLKEIENNHQFAADFESYKNELVKNVNDYKNSLFEILSNFGLNLTANYAIIRVHILKYIATLSCLDHDVKGFEVKRLFLESLKRMLYDSKEARRKNAKGQNRTLPRQIVYLTKLVIVSASFLPGYFLQAVIRRSVRFLAKRFIAGENIHQALKTIDSLKVAKIDATLDQLGELVVSSAEADNYLNSVLQLINGLANKFSNSESNDSGILKAHVSIKVSALASRFKSYSFDSTYDEVSPRLAKILIEASKKNVFINIDAEHYEYRDIVFNIYKKVLESNPDLKNFKHTGIVVQAYLRDSASHLKEVIAFAQSRDILMPIRLVKGAYWDAETVEANAHNFIAPQFLNKEESDINFRQLVFEILKNGKNVQLCLASHNILDHCFARALHKTMFTQSPVIEHQCLHMTYTALSNGLARMGWATRNYIPVGNLLVGMGYLVRRIMENSSQVGFLTLMRSHKKMGNTISPAQTHQDKIASKKLVLDKKVQYLTPKFFNIEPVRLFLKDDIADVLNTFEAVQKSLPLKTEGDIKVISNSDGKTHIGNTYHTDISKFKTYIDSSLNAFNKSEWKENLSNRILILLKAAELLTIRRAELSSIIMLEAGKTIKESLADVDEAVDFINFYARQAIKLFKNKDKQAIGPIGVIAPWNFPLAIACGMTVAPLACGNTVILKPAEATPLTAKYLVDILHEAGIPKDVLIYAPGKGAEIGQELVDNDKVKGIVFTGSKTVGIKIYQSTQSKLINFGDFVSNKIALTEMGGKNAIVVTNNCELDETITGILYSAFGHAGQKCSACSRVVVDNKIKDAFLERFISAVKELKIGSAFSLSTDINPLVSNSEKERLLSFVPQIKAEADKNGGTIHLDLTHSSDIGSCIGPLIVELPKERAINNSSFATKELFGPIVHIIGYDNLIEACDIVNATEYALTAGIYCQSQNDIDFLKTRIHTGNIYINRPNTGARVAVEPFGGFKMSGTGPKAGGEDYIAEFVCEKNKIEVFTEESTTSAGSEYSYSLPRASGLNLSSRLKRIKKFNKLLVTDFESIVNDIDPKYIENLKNFIHYLTQNYKSFCYERDFNKKTPGQLNYNNASLYHRNSLYICYESKPSLTCLQFFITSLVSGSGITILTRNEEAYITWSDIVKLVYASGFSKSNIEVYFASAKVLHQALSEPKISFQFIDGHQKVVSEVLDKSYGENNFIRYMKKSFSPYSKFSFKDYRHFLNQTHYKRSYAENIMRHGAPLDLT